MKICKKCGPIKEAKLSNDACKLAITYLYHFSAVDAKNRIDYLYEKGLNIYRLHLEKERSY